MIDDCQRAVVSARGLSQCQNSEEVWVHGCWSGHNEQGTTQLWALQVAGRTVLLLRAQQRKRGHPWGRLRAAESCRVPSSGIRHPSSSQSAGNRTDAGRRPTYEKRSGQAHNGASPPASIVNAVQLSVSSFKTDVGLTVRFAVVTGALRQPSHSA